MLKRIVTCHAEGSTWEADPILTVRLIEMQGLSSATGTSTPGTVEMFTKNCLTTKANAQRQQDWHRTSHWTDSTEGNDAVTAPDAGKRRISCSRTVRSGKVVERQRADASTCGPFGGGQVASEVQFESSAVTETVTGETPTPSDRAITPLRRPTPGNEHRKNGMELFSLSDV